MKWVGGLKWVGALPYCLIGLDSKALRIVKLSLSSCAHPFVSLGQIRNFEADLDSLGYTLLLIEDTCFFLLGLWNLN